MDSYKFDLDAYLERINFTGPTDVSHDTLVRLHHAHFFTIPFENFDILLGRNIDLDPQVLFNKLVLNQRGGYCFELNGLFLQGLQALGFDARPLLARVHVTGRASGRGHQLELISIDGQDWVADVGFGGNSPRTPIPMDWDRPVIMENQTLRLMDGGEFGTMLQTFGEDEWKDLYSFDLGKVFPSDIAYGNYYASTNPNSLFTSSRFAARPLPGGGEVTLLDRILKIKGNGEEKVLTLPDTPAYLDALKEHFGIVLDVSYQDLKPLPPVSDDVKS